MATVRTPCVSRRDLQLMISENSQAADLAEGWGAFSKLLCLPVHSTRGLCSWCCRAAVSLAPSLTRARWGRWNVDSACTITLNERSVKAF